MAAAWPRSRSKWLATLANLSNSSACAVGRARADEEFEALAGFVLGGEVAGSGEGFGTVLGGEERLQREGLFDAQAGELVAGLGDLEGAGGIAGAGHDVAEQVRIGIEAV